LSREAFIKLLVMANQMEEDVVGRLPAGLDKGRWSASYISTAYENQWIDSLLDSDGSFNPSQTITRQEVAMLVGKALLESEKEEVQQQWLSTEWTKERDARAFKDHASIDAELQSYGYSGAMRGIKDGDGVCFRPKEALIRQEVAAVNYRFIDMRVSDEKLDFTGYYAIQSSSAINQM